MRNIFFLGLVVGLVLSLASPANAANLLANSGFEAWGPWGPGGSEVPATWWHMFGDPNVTGTKESVIKQGGSFSGKAALSNPTGAAWGGWGQRASVSAGQTLFAHQPINIPSTMTNARATLEIKFESSPDVTIAGPFSTSLTTATGGWGALDFSMVAPAGTTSFVYTVLLANVGGNPSSGIAYFDDAYADSVPIPEPTSMLLLGSGLVGLFGITRKKKS